MDRNRLKEVHQTDLTEGKINEDFVDWLKTKGPTYLLVVLIGLAAWLLIVRFKQQKQDHLNAGWSEFLSAQLPGSFEDVAAVYADIHGLSLLANLRAADVYLQAVIAQAPAAYIAQPIASSSAAAAMPPCATPGKPWCSLRSRKRPLTSLPSTSKSMCRPSGLRSPQP